MSDKLQAGNSDYPINYFADGRISPALSDEFSVMGRPATKEDIERHKTIQTERFIALCANTNATLAMSFFFENSDYIDVRAKRDEAWRNACLAGNVALVQFLCEVGNIELSTCNHIGFNLACLGQHIELANWFKGVDPNYHFEVVDGRIDVTSHKYLGAESTSRVRGHEYEHFTDDDIVEYQNQFKFDNQDGEDWEDPEEDPEEDAGQDDHDGDYNDHYDHDDYDDYDGQYEQYYEGLMEHYAEGDDYDDGYESPDSVS
ncbi:hypothetical protein YASMINEVIRUS_1196 [Yasminevirus sp. GU-2018]|uniref:Ankyrin repeat protein n=1 Tax=Yasminevirus sp. GU-2018 TaxID=2420051 RepID=A0A5K0UAB4_9VIRU|nr:hypothetical protein YASMINEVIRUS_1196 [Yasminevirus sp. GU-2018]